MNTVHSRVLSHHKGVVVWGTFTEEEAMEVSYQSEKGESKKITVHCDQVVSRGDMFYAHIDDETNELLVLSNQPFCY